ncbi:YqaA family protein [Oleiagrimonas soli]|uniref:Membrane protein n=1 Tax=Oleiagrimonas soli TaxID=1543381 RepID=A0A099CUT8_9GAMM|nr:DedA family protein [Oleiagrimonas soli]KGI77509.1 membrane protein [Oleiagrimonas soli]MBB6183023.1 membrane protein YqaA with SNARE-associated domain [Oleiagrimonas soli]
MRLFGPLYERALRWSKHPHAERYLAGLSFIEAFIFPIMPEVMLAPMALAKPERAFRFASVSLIFSLLGSLVGYALGHYAFEALRPLLADLHLLASIEHGVTSLRAQMTTHFWGMMLVLLLAALQPVVPMKFITWASGIVGVPLIPFLLCMALGRGKRVYLLALLIRLFGKRAEDILHRHIERIGWAALILLAGLVVWWLLAR